MNGFAAKIGDKANPENDQIIVNGYRIPKVIFNRVILLNKPRGIISSCNDQFGRKTVLSLIPSDIRKGLYPIGRLDYESRGAILLTNNGDLTLKLTHPKFNHTKSYFVWVKGLPSSSTLSEWRQGTVLDGKITMKAKVNLIKSLKHQSLIQIEMKEGRNRQIRRISEKFGHPVIDLKRVAISKIKLGNLQEGCWREVKEDELSCLYQ